MSHHHIVRTGGAKPPLIPLPIDPTKPLRPSDRLPLSRPPIVARSAAVKAARQQVLEVLTRRTLSLSQIAQEISASLNETQHVLKSLRRDGLIIHDGRTRCSTWRLAPKQGVA